MFDILFKRAKTGKIVSYEIIVQPLEPYGTPATIRKYTGQLEGKKTCHEEQVLVGKQGRNPNEQAVFMAMADWKKKKDEGYKSLVDLGYTGPKFNSPAALLRNLEEMLPAANTDASGNAKPMLAHEYHKHKKKVTFPCYIQPKFDGVRCLMVCTGHDSGSYTVQALSRNGKEYDTVLHITSDIIVHMAENNFRGQFILDGELYSDELGFQDIISAVKSFKESSKLLKFRAYDIINDENQKDRYQTVLNMVGSINSSNIISTDTGECHNEEDVITFFSEYIAQGYEGAMIRLLDGRYESGARSHSLLKYKEFDEAEFTIVGGKINDKVMNNEYHYSYASMNPDTLDSFVFTCLTECGTFDCKPTGTRAERASYMTKFPTTMGKQLTVKHFGWTDAGLPRFPIGKSIRDYE